MLHGRLAGITSKIQFKDQFLINQSLMAEFQKIQVTWIALNPNNDKSAGHENPHLYSDSNFLHPLLVYLSRTGMYMYNF